VNVARNAGAARASGDIVAFLGDELAVEDGWLAGLREGFGGDEADDGAEDDAEQHAEAVDGGPVADADEEGDADGGDDAAGPPLGAVSGPTYTQLRAGVATEEVETRTIAGRSVTYVNPLNVAVGREALEAIDGFDEYLETGGARDVAHRLAGVGFGVDWRPSMCVRFDPARAPEARADGGPQSTDWRWRYRSLAYRLVKNYGPRPTVIYRVGRHALGDAWSALREVAGGDGRPSEWLGNGRDVTLGTGRGVLDGIRTRYRDRDPRRNPNGLSSRTDRAVAVFDRR
jgi:glycosyltransferase involved in cell wall biosynthesis